MALYVPFVWVFEWNFFGPPVTVTLCGALPVQRHVTFVPRLTVTDFGLKKLSPTLTVLLAPNAGMATAPATAARATTRTTAISLFMGFSGWSGACVSGRRGRRPSSRNISGRRTERYRTP